MGVTVSRPRLDQSPILQLHLEPDSPIELGELTGALTALARQYSQFVEADGLLGKGADARLLVSSVSPGSIDIGLLPDWPTVAGILQTAYPTITHLLAFAGTIKTLLDKFKERSAGIDLSVSIRDCDDAINIASPIANHGGHQNVTVFNGPIHNPVFVLGQSDAQAITQNASSTKSLLLLPSADVRQRVALTWTQINKSKVRTAGITSQDRGTIEEIDPRDRPVFFADEVLFLKEEMIGDDENPYTKVYFVDVEISRAKGRVASYRITAFHGKDDLDAT